MKEIGGYIELDRHSGSIYHESAVALNCGRAALKYLIHAKNISKLYIPYFCCDTVSQPCLSCGIDYEYYQINPDFRPAFDKKLKQGEWLYIVNYYGQISNSEATLLREKHGRIIFDNAQSYFQMPLPNTDTIYTCRKFFGVPDGAFLYTDSKLSVTQRDESFERIHFILGRFERNASEFYREASNNNELFEGEPIKLMSKLTENLLRSLDYDFIKRCRLENFKYLHTHLFAENKLYLSVPQGAFMYPYYCENGMEIRKKLQTEKIYIPTLWPDVLDLCEKGSLEYDYAKNILPLPVDQRYDKEDMQYIIDSIHRLK